MEFSNNAAIVSDEESSENGKDFLKIMENIADKLKSTDVLERKFYDYMTENESSKASLCFDKIEGMVRNFEFYFNKLTHAKLENNERDISYYGRFIDYYIEKSVVRFPIRLG
jgi:hypothetical protein